MKAFIQRGIDNPAKQVTVKGFREHLVKGIIEDDLPFTLGREAGYEENIYLYFTLQVSHSWSKLSVMTSICYTITYKTNLTASLGKGKL
jgi:hypothetical protein